MMKMIQLKWNTKVEHVLGLKVSDSHSMHGESQSSSGQQHNYEVREVTITSVRCYTV
jgi:hypothetical protein